MIHAFPTQLKTIMHDVIVVIIKVWFAYRPLPHIRNGRKLFDPPGNPVYAKDCLIFTYENEICEKGELFEFNYLVLLFVTGQNYRRYPEFL